MAQSKLIVLAAAGLFAGAAQAQNVIEEGGWRITVQTPNASIQAAWDGPLFITKVATVIGTIEEGIPSPVVVTFQQIADDAFTASQIVIQSESITNQSGVDWTSYRQQLIGSQFVQWNQQASAGWNPAPFLNNAFWSTNGVTLDVVDHVGGGVVANGATWNPKSNLTIDADLQGSRFPIVFSLKEIPVPTPGTAVLALFGTVAVARRRR